MCLWPHWCSCMVTASKTMPSGLKSSTPSPFWSFWSSMKFDGLTIKTSSITYLLKQNNNQKFTCLSVVGFGLVDVVVVLGLSIKARLIDAKVAVRHAVTRWFVQAVWKLVFGFHFHNSSIFESSFNSLLSSFEAKNFNVRVLVNFSWEQTPYFGL